MSVIPVQWSGGIQEWMRRVASALNPLVRRWPTFTTPGALGYETGAGGTVTQATSKATGVTLDKMCGEITLNGSGLAIGVSVSFTLTNSMIEVGDILILNHVKVGTFGQYHLNGECMAGSARIDVANRAMLMLSEAIVLRFSVIKGVTA